MLLSSSMTKTEDIYTLEYGFTKGILKGVALIKLFPHSVFTQWVYTMHFCS